MRKYAGLAILGALLLSACDQQDVSEGDNAGAQEADIFGSKGIGHDGGDAATRAEISFDGDFTAGQSQQVTLRLVDKVTGDPLGPDDIAIAHTKKVHLLIIDKSLSDYHHIHPLPGKNPGEWVFDFAPRLSTNYRVWADIVPVNGNQEYVGAIINAGDKAAKTPDTAEVLEVTSDGLNFSLSFDGPLKAGENVIGSVSIMDASTQEPFTQLEPIMGAFGHVVAFAGDWDSIEHVHPRGPEPTSDDERSGPVLTFHMRPAKSGTMKIFVQTQVNGKDVFAPFTVQVAE
jgi:hypothetical protein